jgi:hypothetical protein
MRVEDQAGPRPLSRMQRLRGRIESHLASRDVARVIYGAIVGLAMVLALGKHPPSAAGTAALIAGTAVAVGLAELYSEVVSAEARTRRPVKLAEVRHMLGEAAAVILGAGFPTVFFIVAATGLIELDTAFTLSKWTGLGLICGYAFFAARLAGSSIGRSLVHMAALGAIAGALIALKAVLH